MNVWDIALIAVVSVMGTAVAYLRHAEMKATVLMLPVPFSLAILAVGRPLDATNVLSMGLLFGFSLGVWILRAKLHWPIVTAIAVCATGYCLAGAWLTGLDLSGPAVFWASAAFLLASAVVLIRLLPHRDEPHHVTSLPVWIKTPLIALVIGGLVLIKPYLGGFMTMFPMVGVVAAYEARNSLWAIVRHIPWVIVIMVPMMGTIYLTQSRVGVSTSLLLSWPLLLSLLWGLRSHYMGARQVAPLVSRRA